jgi:hypothetical protein
VFATTQKPLIIKISNPEGDRGIWAEIEGIRFLWKPYGVYGAPFTELGKMSPADAGFLSEIPAEARKALAEARGIVIELPSDDLAALNWEALSPYGLVRRSLSRTAGRLSGPAFPIRMAILSANDNQARIVGRSVPELLSADIEAGRVIIDTYPIRRFTDVTGALGSHHYDVVHVAVPTVTRGRHAQVEIGHETFPLKHILGRTLAHAPRFAFFHADTEDVFDGISGLRMSSQEVENGGTACVLHASPADDVSSSDFIAKTYEEAFIRDRTLAVGLGVGHRERSPIFMTSVAAPAERTSLLDLLPALHSAADRNAILTVDLERARRHEPGSVGQVDFEKRAFLPGAPPAFDPGKSLLSELFDVTQANVETSVKLNEELSDRRAEIDRPDLDRYPIGNFYYCAGDAERDWVPIPEIHTLREGERGRSLEFHFWIDPIRGGIRSVDMGVFSPKDAVYPLRLRAQVWTGERMLAFSDDESEIEIPARGPSKHARFVLSEFPKHDDVEFFLFLSTEDGSLIAAFQIKAKFREEIQVDNNAQLITQLYSSSDYFRFPEAPGSSALTILLDKGFDGIRVFTLSPGMRPWAKLGIAESSINDRNRDIYKDVTHLALAAAASEREGRTVEISETSMTALADKGYVLLKELFKVNAETEARTFIDFVLALELGSRITIATSESAAQFMIPWGLLYLDRAFRDFPYQVSHDSFLGYKYNVVVRPSMPLKPRVELHQPVRMAAAWLSRPETEELKSKLETAQAANQIRYVPVKAENGYLPALNGDFDLIHFYCHGHTRFPNDFHPEEFIQIFRDSIPAASGTSSNPVTTELQQFLQKVANASDSLMQLDGGFVYRSDLADKLDDFKRAPIVLLSMCESAQVTSSGAGFVTLFLNRGARAAMGTEGPTLWSLGRDLDLAVITRLLAGETIGTAFFEAKREMVKRNPLALVYSLWGDRDACIAARPTNPSGGEKP